jgi:hypothetical protein
MLSLAKMCDTYTLTVPGAMNRRRAMASFRKPSLTRRTTSSSAGVRLRAEVRSDQQANVTAPAGGDPRKRLPIW